MPDAPVAPGAEIKKKPEPMITFGVDKELSIQDSQIVTFAVMCNITHMTVDRGPGLEVPRPLYEWPLLVRRYRSLGGSAEISAKWLYHNEVKGPCYPREVKLNRATLRAEMQRLQKAFTLVTPQGKVSLFDMVYDRGENNRFVKVVNNQAKAWNALKSRMKQENRHIPTLDELQAIADLANPPLEGEPDMELILPQEDAPMSTPVIDMDDDPTFKLQSFLTEKGVSPMIASHVARLHGESRVLRKELEQVPELHGKQDAILQVEELYQVWKKKESPSK